MDSKIGILDLPTEIKEYILLNLDGISLARMKTVSKEWKEIMDNPNKKLLNKWKDVCRTELDDAVLRSILKTVDPKYYLCPTSDLWEIAFKNWHQWHLMPKWDFNITKLYNTSDCEITSINNSGEWLIISTRNYGSVLALNYNTKDTEELYKGANVGDVRPYTVCEDKPLLKGFAHDKLTLEFENLIRADLDLHTLRIDYSEELTKSRQIHHFENKEIKIDVNNEATSTATLTRNPGMEKHKHDMLLNWNIEHCWTNGNLLACTQGYYIVTDDNFATIVGHPFTFSGLIHKGERPIKCYFGSGVIISINKKQYGNHEMIVRVLDKEKKYLPFIALSKHFTSIMYHGLMLIVGTDVGSVIVYKTEHILDLLQLDLITPFAVFEFENDPIISLALRETLNKPILWCANHYRIYQLKFI